MKPPNAQNMLLFFRFLSLMAMHFVLAGQYRVAMLMQPAWLAYAFMGLVMVVCSSPWWISRWDMKWPIGPVRLHGDGGSAKRAFRHNSTIAGTTMLILMGAGLFARWLWIRRLPIDPSLGDMLPQIQAAIRDWLAGEFPYRVHYFPWPIHLPYPPALWEAYIPAEMAGLDLRYTTLACLAIMGGAWILQFKALVIRKAAGVRLWAWVALTGAFFLSPLVLRFVIQGHTAPYWLALTIFPLLLHSRHNVAAAMLLGGICAMRQPSILYVPIVAWYWMQTQSWRRATLYVGLAAATALLIFLPFIAQDAAAVWWAPIRQYSTVGHETFIFNPSMILETIGFSNLLYLAGWDRFLSPVAAATFAFLFALNRGRMNTAMETTRVMALVSLGFTLWSPIPFYYEYFPVLVLFMQAWWMEAAIPADPAQTPVSARSM